MRTTVNVHIREGDVPGWRSFDFGKGPGAAPWVSVSLDLNTSVFVTDPEYLDALAARCREASLALRVEQALLFHGETQRIEVTG